MKLSNLVTILQASAFGILTVAVYAKKPNILLIISDIHAKQASVGIPPTAEALADKDSGSVWIARVNTTKFFLEQKKTEQRGQTDQLHFPTRMESRGSTAVYCGI